MTRENVFRTAMIATNILLGGFIAWRSVWLADGLSDVTAEADCFRKLAVRPDDAVDDAVKLNGSRSVGNHRSKPELFRISFADADVRRTTGVKRLCRTGADLWDSELPIWITPGADGQPGWAGWDDNSNGQVDEPAELGAAWSDDFCVVQTLSNCDSFAGRIIDHGAYRSPRNGEFVTRIRYRAR